MSIFLIDRATGALLKIDVLTWAFLEIDMGHGDPSPIKGRRRVEVVGESAEFGYYEIRL